MSKTLSNRAGKLLFFAALELLVIQTTPSNAQDYYKPKSENAALALSLFGTILPVGTGIMLEMDNNRESDVPFWLAAGGLVVGPSLGYFHGGVERRAWKGLALRSTVAFATLFIVAMTQDGITVQGNVGRGNQGVSSADVVLLFIGSSAVALSALDDIFSVSDHVKKRNQKLFYGDFTLLPTYFPQHKAGGLVLHASF